LMTSKPLPTLQAF